MPNIQKILIIRFSSIGDIILASPLIRGLRLAYPTARIDFLVKSDYADLVRFNPYLTNIISLGTSEFRELRKLKKKILLENYDAILDIHNSLRSRYIRYFTGAKVIGVVNKYVVRRFVLVNFKVNMYRAVIPVAERYLQVAKRLGVHDDSLGLEVFIPEDIKSTVSAVLEKYKLGQHNIVVGLAPGARHFTKRWPQDRFVQLGARLAKERNAKVFIFGGKQEEEYCGDIMQMINSQHGGSAAVSFAGKFSLLETVAALDYCYVVVSNDSGLMHLAAGRKKKVVVIFGSTVKQFGFFPYGTESIVVEQERLNCRPCSHIGLEFCPKGHFLCMKNTQVEDVFRAVNKLLSV